MWNNRPREKSYLKRFFFAFSQIDFSWMKRFSDHCFLSISTIKSDIYYNPGVIPGWGISPGEGNGNPLQYSCLENSRDRGAWWATAHGITKSQTLSLFTWVFTWVPHKLSKKKKNFINCISACDSLFKHNEDVWFLKHIVTMKQLW